MERLTARDRENNAYFPFCFEEPCNGAGCKKMGLCKLDEEVCKRLAAYEDTGLEPDDIRAAVTPDALVKLASQVLGVQPDHLRDLLQAEKDGRVCILHKGEDGTCGGCGHFKRIPGKRCGTCEVRSYFTDSRGRIEANRGQFTPSQSRKCCKQYIPRKEAEAALQKGDTHETDPV